MIKAIVCVDENWSIGKDNDLLFHLKEDMKFFKAKTTDQIVFCGYNTLISFPKSTPLKNRSTICICPSEVNRDDCFCVHDFNTALSLVKELSKTQDIYVIGGAMLYKAMLPYYDYIYVTKVKSDGEGTSFFPNLDTNSEFELIETSPDIIDNNYTINFCTYKRVNVND